MGNQCAGSHTAAPKRQPSASHEPPLAIKPVAPISTEVLDAKSSQLINLQLQAFEASKQGKHLAETLGNEKKKAANLLQSVGGKVKQLQEELKKFIREDGSVTPEGVEFVKAKRADVQELMSAVGNLSKTALARTEEQYKAFVQKQEKVKGEVSAVVESVSDQKSAKNLPQAQTAKLSEFGQTATKISMLQDESKKSLCEIEANRAAIEQTLQVVPELMGELAQFVKIDTEADATGEIVVEEMQSYDAAPAEVEVAAEVQEVEEHVSDCPNEMEVAAEAEEAPAGPAFEEIFNAESEAAQAVAESLLSQLPPETVEPSAEVPAFLPADVYHTFNQILAKKVAVDSELRCQPMPIDVCTVDFFLQKYGNSAPQALSEFSKSLKDMINSSLDYGQFIADVLGIESKKPYSKAITDKVASFSRTLDLLLKTQEKLRAVMHARTASEGASQFEHMGGALYLLDILRAFSPLMMEFPEYSAKFLERVQPPALQHFDFLHFILVHHMKLSKVDGVALFKSLSKDSSLSFEEFAEGVRSKLNWRISPDSLQKLFYMIQNPDTGVIHRLDFIRFLRLQQYVENAQNDAFLVPKLQVLEALAQVCDVRRKDLITQIYSKYKELEPGEAAITPEKATALLRALGEARDVSDAVKKLSEGKGKLEDFVRVVESCGLQVCEKPYFREV